jgi:hypothetical protein
VAISAFILHLVRFLKGLAVEIWKEEKISNGTAHFLNSKSL